MNLPKYLRLPILMVCITVIVCIILMLLPLEQVLRTYEIVNGVKSVVYIPKIIGVIGYFITSVFVAALWAFIRRAIDKEVAQNSGYFSYRFIRIVINVMFLVFASLTPVLGIISIVETYGG